MTILPPSRMYSVDADADAPSFTSVELRLQLPFLLQSLAIVAIKDGTLSSIESGSIN